MARWGVSLNVGTYVGRRDPRFLALAARAGLEARPLRRFVANSGLQRHMRFLGAVHSEEVQALLAAADILFLPSAREGLALMLQEAMAMGTVPAAAGGQAELVTPECGYLLPHGEGEIEA